MNYAIVLSGGTGTRFGSDIPKQYIEAGGKPVIMYCLDLLQRSSCIDGVCIVVADEWRTFIRGWSEKCGIDKCKGFAPAGRSRQHSIMNGMDFLKARGVSDDDLVLIHDAARPNLTEDLIKRCMDSCRKADGVLPVISVKDTIYLSEDRQSISGLLNRDQLFAGQAPEAFVFGKYYDINKALTDEELGMVRGSSEIAYRSGLKVVIIDGDENNFKITTAVDLEKFEDQLKAERIQS